MVTLVYDFRLGSYINPKSHFNVMHILKFIKLLSNSSPRLRYIFCTKNYYYLCAFSI